jgi:hypothetical protein
MSALPLVSPDRCIDYVKVSTKETKLKYNKLSENVLLSCTLTSTEVADNDQMVLNNGELDVEGNGSTASNHSDCSKIEDS